MHDTLDHKALLRQVKTAVQEVAPGADVILYGSRARGTATADSDWDFLILLPGPRRHEVELAIKDRLYALELATDTLLNTIVRSRAEWGSARYAVLPFRRAVERDGVVI